jgi:leucyl aminopeptidase (aminopeptidase T)
MKATTKGAAGIACREVLKLQKDEEVVIISNPEGDVATIAQALYNAASDCGAKPVLITQPVKTQLDFAENAVNWALKSKPAVILSISENKMGKDSEGIAKPYKVGDKEYDSYFHLLVDGEKCSRSFWSPGVTLSSFCRTVPIDYDLLRTRAAALCSVLNKAETVRVTSPAGTDVWVGIEGRKAQADDGDFSRPGTGGNLPAGEVFISPALGATNGRIVFDGSVTSNKWDGIVEAPVTVTVEKGFVTNISGRKEAHLIEDTITMAENNATDFEAKGKLPPGSGEVYRRNARAIGELGIGLNPEAIITGNMLEDEKAFHTCHFAIGANYDDDGPALIHLDCLVRNPTITAIMDDGTEVPLLKNGDLLIGA